ncbi:MAG: HpcH/HpaI aldolase family protein [Pseudolabrys sp.]
MASFSLARRLRAGEIVYCGWCALPAPILPEVMAREGFAAVAIDMQHGLWDFAACVTAIGAVHGVGAAPIVRVSYNDFALVSRALDMGAEGIIAPMINTVDDAKKFVAVAKFPAVGERSWGPNRAMMVGGFADQKAYLRDANDMTVTIAMIETRTALANVEAIAATRGIDVLFVGPSDLSITMSGGAVLDPVSKEVEAALDQIVAAAKKAGKVAGLYCANAERAVKMAKRGFGYLAVGSDLGFFRDGIGAQMKVLKG